ncbi:MAG: hypothetical protein CFE41_00015 [Burkholderiales bacterium PBB2]|nr:MAG: hypothetical protein CFE41_00015 [Burkholderiales bacterium PBB2]
MDKHILLMAASLALGATGAAQAQATVKTDGQFRSAFGLGASMSSGNTRASNLSITGDAVRATDQDKLGLYLNAQYAKSNGTTTGEQLRTGGRYDYNLGTDLFAFGGLDLARDKFANLSLRGMVSTGLGYHALKTTTTTLDLFGGLGYTRDSYINPTVIDSSLRSRYGYVSALLGEESTHKLSETTSFKQRLVVLPNLSNRGEFRANWDAGLAVAMTKTMNLTVGAGLAYNSEPGAGRKRADTLLTTGVSIRFD